MMRLFWRSDALPSKGTFENTVCFPMKIEGRKRRGHSKKERERQLDTPKNHSQHLSKKRIDLESILLHFGPILDPKMDTKSNPNSIRK